MATETVQEIDGFKIDMNLVNRREFHEFMGRIAEAQLARNGLLADMTTGELLQRVMVEWPFDAEISADAYLNLPLHDGKRVDRALEEAIETVLKKK